MSTKMERFHQVIRRQAEEIEVLREALKQEEQHAFQWRQTALAQGESLAPYIILKDRYREALQKIIETGDKMSVKYEAVHLVRIAREALEND